MTRTALLRVALLALVTVLGCGAVPGPTDPTPSHNGEFTGRYHEGLPVYAFPTIYVVGHRTAE